MHYNRNIIILRPNKALQPLSEYNHWHFFAIYRTDFEWLKMIRYYWEEDIDNCVARMSSALYIYGHEYLGAGGRLTYNTNKDNQSTLLWLSELPLLRIFQVYS